MRAGEASRTAEYMALFRALETTRPARRRLFADPYARAFLSPRLRLIAGLSRGPGMGGLIRGYIDHRWPGTRTSAVARTRVIDDAVVAALADGAHQVVLLGAGFDARAYRLPAMARATVFEVDHPATSARKRAAIVEIMGAVPAHARLVPVDFDSAAWPGTVEAAGFDHDRRTVFVWEGVTNYLTAEAVDRTLRWCARAAAGSTVVFTYVDRRVLDRPEAFEGTARLFATLAAAGERWTFGLDPQDLPRFLADRGLVLGTDLAAAEYRARCFGPAAARMRGYEFYRIAVAHVRPRRRRVDGAGLPRARRRLRTPPGGNAS